VKLNRQLVLTGLAVLGLAIWDFATRIYVPRASDSSRSTEAPVLMPAPPESSADTISADLRIWMPSLGAATDVAGGQTPVGSLALMAVFREGSRSFALLGPASPDSVSGKLTRISAGESVQGLRVADIGRDRVRLVGEDGTVHDLIMFKLAGNAIVDDRATRPVAGQAAVTPAHVSREESGMPASSEVRPPWLPPGAEVQTPRQLGPGEDLALENRLQPSPTKPVKR